MTGFAKQLLLGMLLAGVYAPAFAIQRGYLIEQAVRPGAIANSALDSTRISIYFDPMYTNWIGWSQLPETVEQEGAYKIGQERGSAGLIDGYVVMTLVDPSGRRSGAYILDDNDAAGNPVGRQAVVYGSSQEAPNVLRANRAGEAFELDEAGEADKFFDRGGAGDYTIELKYVGRNPGDGHGPVYLVMDVVEGFEPHPPVRFAPQGGLSGLWGGGDRDRGGDGDNGLRRGTIIDPPLFPPDSPFPPPPINNEPDPDDPEPQPVVPEPATWTLIGLGLAGAAALRRRNRS